jgi:hypothetical protein
MSGVAQTGISGISGIAGIAQTGISGITSPWGAIGQIGGLGFSLGFGIGCCQKDGKNNLKNWKSR